MAAENPARSGDKVPICWMTKDKDDFFDENYNTSAGQIAIIQLALEISDKREWDSEELQSFDLRVAVQNPNNKWFRNVRVYLGTHTQTHTHSLSLW